MNLQYEQNESELPKNETLCKIRNDEINGLTKKKTPTSR